jgi:hypothetical protein
MQRTPPLGSVCAYGRFSSMSSWNSYGLRRKTPSKWPNNCSAHLILRMLFKKDLLRTSTSLPTASATMNFVIVVEIINFYNLKTQHSNEEISPFNDSLHVESILKVHVLSQALGAP